MPEDPIYAERRRLKLEAVPPDERKAFQFDIDDYSEEEQRMIALEYRYAKELQKRGLWKGYKKDRSTEVRAMIARGWQAMYATLFGQNFVDVLAPHHIEAIEWHWHSRLSFLTGNHPEYLAYFPIWSRGHMKCLDEHSKVLMGDGTQKYIKDVRPGDSVQSFHETTGKIIRSKVIDQWHAGAKQCVTLTTRTGWQLTGTPDHRIRTFEGWKKIGELLPTDRIASPRRTLHSVNEKHSDEELRLLTYFLAEGCTVGNKATITNSDPVIVEDVIFCAKSLGFTACKTAGKYNTSVQNGVRAWLRLHNLAGYKSTSKRLPELFFNLTERQLKIVLAAWLDTDGFISTQSAGINLANEGLINDLRYLCLQLGIVTKKYYLPREGFGSWVMEFDHHNICRLGSLPLKLKSAYWDRLQAIPRYSLIDCYPQAITQNLPKGMNRRLRREIGWKPAYDCARVTRDKIQRAMAVYQSPTWMWHENADVFWDEIKSIEDAGERDTYDLEIEGTHSFIANGLVTHNSSIAERMVVVDAVMSSAFKAPGYALYVARNKDKVQEHIANIEALLASGPVKELCPALSTPKRTEITNQQRRWTSSFLKTGSNYSIQGGTLDSGLAGSRVDETRVTMLTLDDIDGREDSPVIAETRFRQLTTEILPMRQENTLVFWAQNLISRYSVMYRIQKGQARVLTNRKPTEAVPAVRNLVTQLKTVEGIPRDIYVSGDPTWQAWSDQRIQDEIDTEGLPSFLREAQHEVEESKELQIFYNYDDSVHVISESEFAAVFGSRDAWLSWRKKPGNDWARTKTDKHANVAGWLVKSSEDAALPNFTFLMHPMSFPPDSAPEDVAERLLSCLSLTAFGTTTWQDLRRDLLRNANAADHAKTVAEKIDYERGALQRVIPKYTKPLLQRCNVQQGDMSHEMDTVRKIYASVYGMGFRGANPGKHGGVEAINRDMRVDYSEEHPFRPDEKGYTRWFMVAPDDDTQDPYRIAELWTGKRLEVRPPRRYPDAFQSHDLVDSDLWRFQFRNYNYRAPILSASGEEIDTPLKMLDDAPNLCMMWYTGSQLSGNSLTMKQKIDLVIPQETHQAMREASTGAEKLGSLLDYEFQREWAEMTLNPRKDEDNWE